MFHHLQAAGAVPLLVLGALLVLWVVFDGDGTRRRTTQHPYPRPYDQEKEK